MPLKCEVSPADILILAHPFCLPFGEIGGSGLKSSDGFYSSAPLIKEHLHLFRLTVRTAIS